MDPSVAHLAYRSEVRQRFSWEQIVLRLGLGVTRRAAGGFIGLCVFHNEKTPSLRFYPDGNFRCYGCGTDGDIVDFVSRFCFGTPASSISKKELQDFFESLPEPFNSEQMTLPFE